jgi:hypothetical protein
MTETRTGFAIPLCAVFVVCSACTGAGAERVDRDLDDTIPCLTLQNPYLTEDYIQKRRESGRLVYHVLDTIRIEAALEVRYNPFEYDVMLRMIMSEADFLVRDVSAEDPWVLLSSGRAILLGVNGDFLAEFGGKYHWLEYDKERWETLWSTQDRWGNYSSQPMVEDLYLRVLMDEATYLIQEDSLSTRGPVTGCIIGLPIIVAYPLIRQEGQRSSRN